MQCADFVLQRINQTVRPKTKNWKAHTVVCHGNLATRAEEVKTEIAVIFLHLRISTLYSPCSPPPKHTFWFLQVVVHWIQSFISFNDLVFDNFYLWRIRGITYWAWNFRASVDTSLIKTLSLLCITQVLPTRRNFPSECEPYIDNLQFLYISIAPQGHTRSRTGPFCY